MSPDSPPLRTFVAFPLSAATRAALAEEIAHVSSLEPRARVVAARDAHLTLAFHLTIAFIGATPSDHVAAIVEALRGAAAGESSIEAVVEGLGAFPSASRPRVVWAGLRETLAPGRLARLADRVRVALAAVGHPITAEPSGFKPHVTLARILTTTEARSAAPPLKLALTEGALQRTYMPEMLSDLQLMVSEREADGSGRVRYRPLATVSLSPRPERL